LKRRPARDGRRVTEAMWGGGVSRRRNKSLAWKAVHILQALTKAVVSPQLATKAGHRALMGCQARAPVE
jgi:hypothetical protein